jgi:hypothetical protein
MKLDADTFPMDLINFEEKRVLVRTYQADSTQGKKVIMSDELRWRLMRPTNPKVGVWKDNMLRKSYAR